MNKNFFKNMQEQVLPSERLVSLTRSKIMQERALRRAPKAAPSFLKFVPLTAAACLVIAAVILIMPVVTRDGGEEIPALSEAYEPSTPPVPPTSPEAYNPPPPRILLERPEYYPRDEIRELFNLGYPLYAADIRQNHGYVDKVCGNFFYMVIEEQRVCSTCGYIFNERQNMAIGFDPQNLPEPYPIAVNFVFPINMEIASVSEWGHWDGGYIGHTGIDFSAPHGTEIYTVANGTVTFAEWSSGYGNLVIISHPGEGHMQTLYAHCNELLVSEGDYVMQGDIIALVGDSGRAAENHLHFEVRNVNDDILNPKNYLPWD
jgi:murein DD-endopeptidase MepM/ murein hydrolase activator NlpD